MAEITSFDIPPDPTIPVTLVVDVSNAVLVRKAEDINNAEEDKDLNGGHISTPKPSVVILQSDVQLKDPDLQVLEIEENKYSIIFMPPKPGLYSMAIKYNDENVSGSPLQLNLSPPDAKQVSLTKQPTGKMKMGQAIGICFNSLLAGRGMFTATCKGEELGDIPVTVTRLGTTGTHKISFLPLQEDEYSLCVYYSGVSVKGSPYKIDLIPVKANVVKCSQPVFPKGRSGPVEVDICTVGSGNAQLTATCAGTGDHKIPVNIDKVSKDNYRLKIDPPKDDLLTLTIKYGGKEVQDSPFLITITKSEPSLPKVAEPLEMVEGDSVAYMLEVSLDNCANVAAVNVAAVNAAALNAAAAVAPVQVTFGDIHIPEIVGPTHEVSMAVNCPEACHASLTAEYMGQNGEGSFPASVEEIEPGGKYRAKFCPMIPGIYTLTLYLGGEVIPEGIFEIDLLSKPCAKLVRHLGTCIPHDIGEPVMLKFDTSKAGPGTMRGRVNAISQAGHTDSQVDLVDEENGIYHLTFIPGGAGMYNVDMYWCDESIPASPIYIPITYPKEVILSDPVNPQINYPIFVSADTTNSGPGDLTAHCSGIVSGDTVIKIDKDSDIPTKYKIYFHPNVADFFILRVYFCGIQVKQSPIEIDLRVQIKSPSLEPVDGEVIPVHPIAKPYVIQCVDQLDNMKDIKAFAIHDDSCIRHFLRIRKGNDGKSLLVFYPQNTGLHFIHIKKASKEILGSPFKVEIAGSNPSACAIADVPEKSYLNELVAVKIDASKAGAGDLNILATVPKGGTTAFDHSENGSGIFTVRFTPKVVGKYKIDVKWADVTLSDSPIIINVFELTDQVRQARDAASKVAILEESENSLRDKLLHTNGVYFYVETDQIGQGKFTLKSQGPVNPIIKIYQQETDLYKCKVNPVVSGKYDISILWNDIPIPNNPIKLDFTADKTYIIHDLDLESEHFNLHQPYKFCLNCGQNKGTLNVMATPMDSALVEVNLLQNNIYLVKIIPQVQGNHELSLMFAGKHVLQSPYHVQFESPKTQQLCNSSTSSVPDSSDDDSVSVFSASDFIKIIANGPGLLGGIIGQEGNFTIETGSAIEGKLEISIQGPKGTFNMRVRRHPDDDRTLLARYDPTHIGDYTINILWCEKHIEGSPFVVNIKAQNRVLTTIATQESKFTAI